MVSRLVCAGLLVLAGAAGADDLPGADSSAVDEARIEDALDEDALDPGLMGADEEQGAGTLALGTRGSLRVTPGAHALAFSITAPVQHLRLDVRLAREPGEKRAFDDRALALAWRPTPRWEVAVGRLAPMVGRGLVLGPPRTTTGRPALSSGARVGLAALPAASPARAAAGVRGAWLARTFGAWQAAVLAAETRRDARPSPDTAWLPVASARHRNPEEEARRARLRERLVALALARPTWWLVVAHARTDPRRAPPETSAQAAEAAAPVTTGGPGLEFGFRAAPSEHGRAEAAIALDARGRARFVAALETARASPRAALAVETEARGFTPLLARPDKRPHAHVGVFLKGPLRAARGLPALALALEAHAIERRAFTPARLWAALRLERAGQGAGTWLELRRDADPARTLLAVQVASGALAVGASWRFDRAGLAREAWHARAAFGLPQRIVLTAEARLSGGRTAATTLDPEVPGGLVVRTTGGWGRVRLDLVRRGRVTPRLTWLRTQSSTGAGDEARLAIQWVVGPP